MVATQEFASVIVIVYDADGRFVNVTDDVTLLNVVEPSVTVYGPLPPNGATAMDPFDVQVVFVTVSIAFTPALIWIRGSVPHFGLIVDVLFSNVGHVLFGEASVHARFRLIIRND